MKIGGKVNGTGTSVHDSPMHKLYEPNHTIGQCRIYQTSDSTRITGSCSTGKFTDAAMKHLRLAS